MKKSLITGLLALLCLFAKAQSPCDQIKVDKDEVRGYISYTTPYDLDAPRQIWITKIKEPNKKPVYYVHMRQFSAIEKTVNGAFIMLANGKRISKPNAEISIEVDSENDGIIHTGYIQQADIILNQTDLALFKSSPISKFAFSYFEAFQKDLSDLYQQFLCLSKN